VSENETATDGAGVATADSGSDTLTVTDNRTGKTYELEITDDTIKAIDLRQIKVNDDDFGMMAYDPAFTNTASCRSAITFIDGERGILQHRGIPIEQLCEKSSFLEVAFLLIYGELPTEPQLERWLFDVTHHTFVHEDIKQHLQGFRYDAHPMGMLLAGVGALSTFYPEAKQIDDIEERYMAAVRMIAKMPTLAAFAYRHNRGLPYNYPDNDLSFSENFLSMLFKATELKYEPDPRLAKALDVLFILHADHEQNCSTNAVRAVGSSQVDPYSAVAAGVAALYGPLHGGANEAVLRMLRRIEKVENMLVVGWIWGFGTGPFALAVVAAVVVAGVARRARWRQPRPDASCRRGQAAVKTARRAGTRVGRAPRGARPVQRRSVGPRPDEVGVPVTHRVGVAAAQEAPLLLVVGGARLQLQARGPQAEQRAVPTEAEVGVRRRLDLLAGEDELLGVRAAAVTDLDVRAAGDRARHRHAAAVRELADQRLAGGVVPPALVATTVAAVLLEPGVDP
jgi:hypothetical protein